MNIQISDVSLFRRSIDALRDFLPQAQIHISSTGLSIRGMDASHVGFVDYHLSAEDCESIQVKGASNIGISTVVLSKVLGTSGNAEHLTLSESGDFLKVTFSAEGKASSFELSTLDLQGDTVELPDMSYGATVKAKAADIAGVIKDLSIFSEDIIMSLNEEGFHVKAEGDTGKGAVTLEPTDDREMTLEGDSVDIRFAMKYLQQIMRSACSLATNVEIAFDPGQPLRVSSRFGKGSHLIAYLAPKIDE